MIARRTLVLAVTGGAVAVLSVAALWSLASLKFFDWEAPFPGTLVAERLAPDSTLVARVTAGAIKGRYVFELRNTQGDLVASDTIAAPAGYHEHLITVRWDEAGVTAIATIDHDFGDHDLEFILSRQTTR